MIISLVEDKHISKSSPVSETEQLICFQNYSDHLLSKDGPLWVDPKVLDPVPNLVYSLVAVGIFPDLCADVWMQSAALTTATVSYGEKWQKDLAQQYDINNMIALSADELSVKKYWWFCFRSAEELLMCLLQKGR